MIRIFLDFNIFYTHNCVKDQNFLLLFRKVKKEELSGKKAYSLRKSGGKVGVLLMKEDLYV